MHPFGIPKYVCELSFAGGSRVFRQVCLLLDKVFTFTPHLEQVITENTHNRWANNAYRFFRLRRNSLRRFFEQLFSSALQASCRVDWGAPLPVAALGGREEDRGEVSFRLLLAMMKNINFLPTFKTNSRRWINHRFLAKNTRVFTGHENNQVQSVNKLDCLVSKSNRNCGR